MLVLESRERTLSRLKVPIKRYDPSFLSATIPASLMTHLLYCAQVFSRQAFSRHCNPLHPTPGQSSLILPSSHTSSCISWLPPYEVKSLPCFVDLHTFNSGDLSLDPIQRYLISGRKLLVHSHHPSSRLLVVSQHPKVSRVMRVILLIQGISWRTTQ